MSDTVYSRYIAWLKKQPVYEGSLRELKAASADSEAAGDTLRLEAMRLALRVAKTLRQRYTPEQAEPDMDMLQEANLAAMSAAESWDPDKGSFPAWVMRRAAGAAIDRYYTDRNGGMGGKDYRAELDDIESLVMLEYVWDDSDEATATTMDSRLHALSVEDNADLGEDVRKLATLVAMLPGDLRQTVASFYGYRAPKLTLKEIAKRDGVALSTVRLRLTTALSAMRDAGKLTLLPIFRDYIDMGEEKSDPSRGATSAADSDVKEAAF